MLKFNLYLCTKSDVANKYNARLPSIARQFFVSISLFSISLFSQTTPSNSRVLSSDENAAVFTKKLKEQMGVNLPIYKSIEYKDSLGLHYLVLTEKEYKKEGDKVFNDSIKAIDIVLKDGVYKVNWKVFDFIKLNNFTDNPDYSIWFWTKYLQLLDIENDGIVDPILVYGTSGNNGTPDGKIKIITFYKNKKNVIRHQNSEMDSDRFTTVDSSFYQLPLAFQNSVKELMNKIMENGNGIFPAGWQSQMNKKSIKFDEK